MFRRLPDEQQGAESVEFTFDGRVLRAHPGDSVAAALLASGVSSNRSTPVSGAPRGPWCMMGACFECLVIIDGITDQQACMVQVRAFMDVRSQLRGGGAG